jgi:hypothetical protein
MGVDEKELIRLYESGLSNVKIGAILNCHDTTVGRLLKKLGLTKSNEKVKNYNCVICGHEIENNFKNRSTCGACAIRVRRYKFKVRAIDYKGGCCQICGYNKSLSGLQFHHLSQNEKEFTISSSSNKSWDVLKNELDKCILLCGNCHSEEHNKHNDEKLLEYIRNH